MDQTGLAVHLNNTIVARLSLGVAIYKIYILNSYSFLFLNGFYQCRFFTVQKEHGNLFKITAHIVK